VRLATPAGLAWLGLLIPLGILYFLSTRPVSKVVSAVWLWRSGTVGFQTHATVRRPPFAWAWVFCALSITAAAFGASRPLTPFDPAPLEQTAFVFDISASMGTLDGQNSRLDQAKQAATAVLRRLAPDAAVLVVAAGKVPASPGFSHDLAAAEQAIARLRPEDTEDDLQRALELASDQLRARAGSRRIVLFTDGVLGSLKPLRSVGIPTEIVQVGSPIDNTGILRATIHTEHAPAAAALGSLADPTNIRVQVLVQVRNFSMRAREVQLAVSQRNVAGVLASTTQALGADAEATVLLEFEATRADAGTGMFVELLPHDAFTTDDRAYLVMPESARRTVWMTPEGRQPSLLRAFAADPELIIREAPNLPEEADTEQIALSVVTGACPTRYPATDFLVVAPPPGQCLSYDVQQEVLHPLVTDWDDQDPALRFLNLSSLQIPAATPIMARSKQRDVALLGSRRGHLMGRTLEYGRRGTIVGFDLEASDWPRKASFVVFARNLVELGRSSHLAQRPTAFTTGAAIALSIPGSASVVSLTLPDGTRASVPVILGSANLGTVTQTGFSYVSWEGTLPGSALLATNLESYRESSAVRQALPARLSGDTETGARPMLDLAWLCALAASLATLAACVHFIVPGERTA
jgi:Ca-activated chloride channel homolog